jgi:D-aminopeptidase
VLQIIGVPVGVLLGRHDLADELAEAEELGSIVIVVATDAPLSDRNLTRLARRAFAGVARTGASMANGSGDYAIAFSTAESVRRTPDRRTSTAELRELGNERVSPLFLAAIEATEEAIYDALFVAESMTGRGGRHVEALPLDRVLPLLARFTKGSR